MFKLCSIHKIMVVWDYFKVIKFSPRFYRYSTPTELPLYHYQSYYIGLY